MGKEYSLFIGIFYPLNEEHKEAIQQVLDQGKNVCIGLREIHSSECIDSSVRGRAFEIVNTFHEEIASGQLILRDVPDINEVCYIS